ncbi:MAG: hypothetical protein JNJ99_11620, partial [Crocinitomicaceae bacterium]|nr:hypothetical protein [Crocinitomicaceae bacterium]
MKKFLLGIIALFVVVLTNAQVIFYVEPPSVNSASYEFTYATTGWGSPDMLNPPNAVQGELVFALDGTSADSLCCGAVTNGAAVTGKIAVLYRGDCQFGLKALNAQNAGAIAVVIINNIPGSPVGMAAGTSGASVTIPVVMISQAAGALLKPEIEAGGTTAFIGAKNGYYNYDLGFYKQHILRAEKFGNLQALSQDNTEFQVELGGWVYNYGTMDQTNVVLHCEVDLGASNLLTVASAPEPLLASGDSIFISLPTFSQPTYANGYYDITYYLTSNDADEFPSDDTIDADFVISDTVFSYTALEDLTLQPVINSWSRGANTTSDNTGCIYFSDPNASKVAISGLTANTVTQYDSISLDGLFLEATLFEWNDIFSDINDAVISDLNVLTSGEYYYTADLQDSNIFISFNEPILLSDNQNYLFCVTHFGDQMFLGYNTDIDYTANGDYYLMPTFPAQADGDWFVAGYGFDNTCGITAHMFTATAGLVELPNHDLTAFPNPANSYINIPMGACEGDLNVTVIDITGKIVSSQNVSMNSSMLTVDVTTL